MLHERGFTLDIWLKSAKPSALLKDPLPKGSKVPKGPASITNRGRVTGHPRTHLLGSRGSADSRYSTAQEAGDSGGHICPLESCIWTGWSLWSHWFRRGVGGRRRTLDSNPPPTGLIWGSHLWVEVLAELSLWGGGLPGVNPMSTYDTKFCNQQASCQARHQDQVGPVPKSKGESANAPLP